MTVVFRAVAAVDDALNKVRVCLQLLAVLTMAYCVAPERGLGTTFLSCNQKCVSKQAVVHLPSDQLE